MGCGSWTSDSFKSYSKSVGRSVSKSGVIDSDYSNQEMFKALDITGSMGDAAVEVAKK